MVSHPPEPALQGQTGRTHARVATAGALTGAVAGILLLILATDLVPGAFT